MERSEDLRHSDGKSPVSYGFEWKKGVCVWFRMAFEWFLMDYEWHIMSCEWIRMDLRMKLNLNEKTFRFDNEIVRMLLEIEEFKGGWKAYGNLAPERLTELQRIATIESIGSSTRIEGARLTDADVSRVMAGLSTESFRSRDEQEVAGYAILMNEIFYSREEMPLTESIIKQMHAMLMRPSDKDERHRGAYKTLENNVAAFDANDLPIGVVVETATNFETPHCMEQLIEWTNFRLEEKTLPPLIVIGMFIVAFLAIHPFQDGNGRLSRALTILLLLRCGYVYVPYSSLESVIEATKQSYYLSLRATQKTLQSDNPDWSVWIRYFLKSLVKQIRNLKVKIENEHLLRTMPEISLRLIETIRDHGPISVADAQALLRVNKYTLRDHFKRLTEEGHLVRIGVGRATKYALH